jgi:hypothetical protein
MDEIIDETQVPNWIVPQMKDDAYVPTYQSRSEAFLKYICICLGGTPAEDSILITSDDYFLVTSDDYILMAKAS